MHGDVVAVELGALCVSTAAGLQLAHQRVEHADQLVALHVVDAPAAVVDQDAQLAAEDRGRVAAPRPRRVSKSAGIETTAITTRADSRERRASVPPMASSTSSGCAPMASTVRPP